MPVFPSEPLRRKSVDGKRFIISLTVPLLVTLTIWTIKIYENLFDVSFYKFGIYPRTIKGLTGILTAPLIHGDFNHIYFNTLYWLIFATGFFYLFPKRAYLYFLFAYFVPGIMVWIFARPSYHIGLSGVIYVLASFLFFIHLLRKDYRMMAVSLVIIFLFSGMIAGLFPKDLHISFESHLAGVVTGFVLAIIESFKENKENQPLIPYSTEYFDRLEVL